MSLTHDCGWMALAADATKSQAATGGPGPRSRWHGATATLSAPAPQALCPGHRRREPRRAHHAAPIAMAANESRARLIKETSLMQEKKEGGGSRGDIKKRRKRKKRETQHMLDCHQNNRNK